VIFVFLVFSKIGGSLSLNFAAMSRAKFTEVTRAVPLCWPQ